MRPWQKLPSLALLVLGLCAIISGGCSKVPGCLGTLRFSNGTGSTHDYAASSSTIDEVRERCGTPTFEANLHGEWPVDGPPVNMRRGPEVEFYFQRKITGVRILEYGNWRLFFNMERKPGRLVEITNNTR